MSSLALITKVLNVLDGLLDKKVDLFIIGGAAAVLGYGSTRTTRDIDTWMTVPPEILEKWAEAKRLSGVDLAIDAVSIAQAAYGVEERATLLQMPLKNIRVFLPSKEDLILMKISRFSDNDREDIAVLIKNCNPEYLLDLYLREFIPYAVGNKRMISINYLEMIEGAFGVDVAEGQERVLRANNYF